MELELGCNKEARDGQVRTKELLGRELFRTDKEEVINVGQTEKPNNEELEVTSPLKIRKIKTLQLIYHLTLLIASVFFGRNINCILTFTYYQPSIYRELFKSFSFIANIQP